MDEVTRVKLKQKFDIAYLIAKENMAFKKMKPLCDIEEKHGVDIGATYLIDHGCASFVESITTDLQENLQRIITMHLDTKSYSADIYSQGTILLLETGPCEFVFTPIIY